MKLRIHHFCAILISIGLIGFSLYGLSRCEFCNSSAPYQPLDYKLTVTGDPVTFIFNDGIGLTVPINHAVINVCETGDMGMFRRETWSILRDGDPEKKVVLKKLKYGDVPAGWSETEPALPLHPDRFYVFDGKFLFHRRTNGEFEVRLLPDSLRVEEHIRTRRTPK